MAEGKKDRSAPLPARIHVIVAREAPYAVVIRRGPTKQVCTIGWNLRTDEFVIGQWLKGRIYEHQCDVSADGRYFIYSATKGKQMPEVGWYWTAISRTPYLKAIGLWRMRLPVDGGGLFGEGNDYWIASLDCHETLREPSGLCLLDTAPQSVMLLDRSPGFYYERLLRDGWTANSDKALREAYRGRGRVSLFEKPVGDFWVLRKIARSGNPDREGRGSHFDEHELVESPTGKCIDVNEWEWADYVRDRLLWSTGGAIYTGRLTTEGIVEERMLHDFNDVSVESIKAPY